MNKEPLRPDYGMAAIGAANLLLNPAMLERALRNRPAPPPPRDQCAKCNKKIGPGKAGRSCEECRKPQEGAA